MAMQTIASPVLVVACQPLAQRETVHELPSFDYALMYRRASKGVP